MARADDKPDFDKLSNRRIQEDAQRLFAQSAKKDITAPEPSAGVSQGSDPIRTRDSIVRDYDAKSSSRARNARLESMEAMRSFQAKEERMRKRDQVRRDLVFNEPRSRFDSRAHGQGDGIRGPRRQVAPRTAETMHDQAMEMREQYERERMRRDALAQRRGDRELIDGRGSIDSRALNERDELVGYSVNADDRHEPDLDSIETGTKWSSRDGRDIRSMSDSITSRSDLNGIRSGLKGIPFAVRALVVVISILLIILVVLLVR